MDRNKEFKFSDHFAIFISPTDVRKDETEMEDSNPIAPVQEEKKKRKRKKKGETL